MRIAGVMSGTSLDGIDVAVIEMSGRQVNTIGFTSTAYPAAVRAAIQACGANLILLPPYSPDFNPIENAFAKFKSRLRKAAARTVETLETAIADAFHTFTPQECANYFQAAGYASA